MNVLLNQFRKRMRHSYLRIEEVDEGESKCKMNKP